MGHGQAQRPQLVAHGGVDTGVAAGDPVARLAGQSGQTAPEGAADPKDMKMHGQIVEGSGQ